MRITTLLVALLLPVLCWGQAPATRPTTRPTAALPPSPTRHATDYVGIVSPATLERITARLKQFENDTSNQVVVVIYRTMGTDEPIEQYTRRIANAWGVGQKGKDNGVVLFVFIDDRQLYLNVGSGLEKKLTDARAKAIIDNSIVPLFKKRDFGGGIDAGVSAILDALD